MGNKDLWFWYSIRNINYHRFYNSNNSANTFTIHGSGNATLSSSSYVSETTILNNATTCLSSLNISGITTLSGNIDCEGGIALTGSNALLILRI